MKVHVRCRCCGEWVVSAPNRGAACSLCLAECTNEGCVVAGWERVNA